MPEAARRAAIVAATVNPLHISFRSMHPSLSGPFLDFELLGSNAFAAGTVTHRSETA
jgi:hypothetical protein